MATPPATTTTGSSSSSTPPEEPDQASFWDHIWVNEQIPKFDVQSPSPCLRQYLAQRKLPLTGRALVPGCGRGYDVLALAKAEGAEWKEIIGLDISPTGVAAARTYLEGALGKEEEEMKSWCHVEEGDFFKLKVEREEGFTFIYDYTFFCAIKPDKREAWARQMQALLIPGTGVLMTLIFPICEKEGGPPYRVSLEGMRELLEPLGFVAEVLEMLPPGLSHPGRDGTTGPWKASSGVGLWKRLLFFL